MAIREIVLVSLFAFDGLVALAVAGFILFNRLDKPGEERESVLSVLLGLLLFFLVGNGLIYLGVWLLFS